MPTPDVTSFLQLTQACSVLRNINHGVENMHALQHEAIREELAGVDSALVGGLLQ
jgi:hypothetical protein